MPYSYTNEEKTHHNWVHNWFLLQQKVQKIWFWHKRLFDSTTTLFTVSEWDSSVRHPDFSTEERFMLGGFASRIYFILNLLCFLSTLLLTSLNCMDCTFQSLFISTQDCSVTSHLISWLVIHDVLLTETLCSLNNSQKLFIVLAWGYVFIYQLWRMLQPKCFWTNYEHIFQNLCQLWAPKADQNKTNSSRLLVLLDLLKSICFL